MLTLYIPCTKKTVDRKIWKGVQSPKLFGNKLRFCTFLLKLCVCVCTCVHAWACKVSCLSVHAWACNCEVSATCCTWETLLQATSTWPCMHAWWQKDCVNYTFAFVQQIWNIWHIYEVTYIPKPNCIFPDIADNMKCVQKNICLGFIADLVFSSPHQTAAEFTQTAQTCFVVLGIENMFLLSGCFCSPTTMCHNERFKTRMPNCIPWVTIYVNPQNTLQTNSSNVHETLQAQ